MASLRIFTKLEIYCEIIRGRVKLFQPCLQNRDPTHRQLRKRRLFLAERCEAEDDRKWRSHETREQLSFASEAKQLNDVCSRRNPKVKNKSLSKNEKMNF